MNRASTDEFRDTAGTVQKRQRCQGLWSETGKPSEWRHGDTESAGCPTPR